MEEDAKSSELESGWERDTDGNGCTERRSKQRRQQHKSLVLQIKGAAQPDTHLGLGVKCSPLLLRAYGTFKKQFKHLNNTIRKTL